MALFTAQALVVFDLGAKTWDPRPSLPWVLSYELRGLDAATALDACERTWVYSNHEGRLCGYDGPSLSVGDMVRLYPHDGQMMLFRCAALGFTDITTDADIVAGARCAEPAEGEYRVPGWDFIAGRRLGPSDSWAAWL